MKLACECVCVITLLLFLPCMNLLGTGCTSKLLFQLGKDMIYLCWEACCVITACMLDLPWCIYEKAFASLFVCHAKFPSADPLVPHHLSASWLVRFGFLFECFLVTFHSHPPVKTWWNYLERKARHLPVPIPLQSHYFEIDYGNGFNVLYLLLVCYSLNVSFYHGSYVLIHSELPWSYSVFSSPLQQEQ